MSARQDADAEHVGVLLYNSAHDHLNGLEDAGVDDFHAGVAKGAGNDLRSSIVAVEARLGHNHTQRLVHRLGCSMEC